MERSVDVTTGESVAFSYELAGLGSRCFAVFIDLAIQFGILLAFFLVLAWIGVAAPVVKHPEPVSKIATAILEGIAIVGLFILFVGYFILFEWRWNGRTPGKRALGIRVVRDGGFPVDFTAAVIRNVVRIMETALGFYLISAISTLLSPENRRLGDFAAGTIVVRDRRFERVTAASLREEAARADDPLVRDLAPAERDLIRRYVARRGTLDAAARKKLAAQIATPVRPKLGASFAHVGDDDLLVHLVLTSLGSTPEK